MRITTFLLGLLLISAKCFGQWQQTAGPAETQATSVEEYFGDWYLGTGTSGLYSSANQGVNWTPVNAFPDTGGVKSITRIINFDDSLFIATYSGIYVAAGNVQTWHKITAPIPDTMYNYDIFVANNELYATAWDFDWVNYNYFTHLYHLNSSHLWDEIPNLPTDPAISSVAALHDTVYCAIPGHGLYFTHNYGATWDSVNAVFGAINTNYVYLVQSHYGKLFAIGYNNANELLSSADGVNWQYRAITQLGGNVARSLAVYGDTVIVGASGGVAYTHDAGVNWHYSFFPDHNFNEIKFLNQNVVFACDNTMGFVTSTDDSLWTQSDNGLPYATTLGLAKPYDKLYAMDEVNMFSTTDHGNTWSLDTSLLWNVRDIPRMGDKLLAFVGFGQADIYSMDQGQSWRIDTGAGVSMAVVQTLVDNANRVIYARGLNDVRRSNDYGKTWKPLFYRNANIPHDTLFGSMARIKNKLFLTVTDTALELLTSTNEGATWQRIHSNSFVSAVEAIDTVLLVNTPGGIERSTDMGSTFTLIQPSMQLYNTYVNGTTVFSYGGPAFNNISYSTDYGTTWTDISTSLDSTGKINKLLMDSTYLYAATTGGSVWRKPLADMGLTYVGDTSNNYHVPVSVQLVNKGNDGKVNVYPNPYNNQSTIAVDMNNAHSLDIKVYDMMGRLVKVVTHGNYQAGAYKFTLGTELPGGVYMLVTNIDDNSIVKKIVKE